MIVVCEPQCKGFSHEKVNSGLLYSLRLTYPEDKLLFFAHSTHIDSIKEILRNDKVVIDNIQYVAIEFETSFNKAGIQLYTKLFVRIFTEALLAKNDKIFFLSFTGPILYLIKKLKHEKKFANMKFAFVLHGDFENVANDILPKASFQPLLANTKSISDRIRKIKFRDLPSKIFSRINHFFLKRISESRVQFGRDYPIKEMLLEEHSDDFRYIALSGHIVRNASRYLDVEKLNISTVSFPTVFSPVAPQPFNKHVKFAVFGYGNPGMLQKVLLRLEQKDLYKNYEIHIIGMDNSGTEEFKNIFCPSPGKPLTRVEMEEHAKEIDAFLILYEDNSYRLSCSGSIIESISYMKPILHFKNDCIEYFNTPDEPMGICCQTIDDYADEMKDIINNYESYRPQFARYRASIEKKRERMAIENATEQIRNSFTF
jgi:hypothetical protein